MFVTKSVRAGVIGFVASAAALAAACGKSPLTTTPAPAPGAAASSGAAARLAGMRSTQTGVYSAAQATAGKELFDVRCAGCHPPVYWSRPDFRKGWQDSSLWKLFDLVRETMPADNPKSLTDQQYAGLIGYMLQAAGMPAGSAPLPSDSATLSTIRMDTLVSRAPSATR